MKKGFTLLFLIICAVSLIQAQITYYIDATGGDDANDGTSPETALKSLPVIHHIHQPGDCILLKRGETWQGKILCISSGEEGNPITIGAYGTGAKPIVTVVKEQKLTWTELGGNIWESPLSYHPRRVLKDGVEILDAARSFHDELGKFIPDFVEWHYNATTQVIHLYSMDSPANHLMEFSSNDYPLEMNDEHYINVENIEFVGGNSGVVLRACTNIHLTNIITGNMSNYGLYFLPYRVGGYYRHCENIVVDSCIIDSKYKFDYSEAGTESGRSGRGPREGVVYRGTVNSELKNSLIKNYCHANINIFAEIDAHGDPVDDVVVANNKIHHNTITSPDVCYGGRIAIDGYCYNNEIYNNRIVSTSVSSQFNGFSNHVHHNIFKDGKDTPLKPYSNGDGFGITLQAYYSSVHDNLFENNLIIDYECCGIYVSCNNTKGDLTDNIFRNNILYNCGTKKGGISIIFNRCSSSFSNDGNFFLNNLVYSPTTTQTVKLEGTVMGVSAFNALSGEASGQTITMNISGDPLFLNLTVEDYHLQPNTPCIDAGTTTKAKFDYDYNSIPFGFSPDVGIYEAEGGIRGGKTEKSSGAFYPYECTNGTCKRGLSFDAASDFVLKSVKVYNGASTLGSYSGDRTFTVIDTSGAIIAEATVYVDSGEQRLNLNMTIPAGTGYQFITDVHKGLWYDGSGLFDFPYDFRGVCSITGYTDSTGKVSGTDYYYFFYEWEIEVDPGTLPVGNLKIYNGDTDISGGIVKVSAELDGDENQKIQSPELHVTNGSRGVLRVQMKQHIISMPLEAEASFCWSDCSSPMSVPVYVDKVALTIAANEHKTLQPNYEPHVKVGYATVMYTAFFESVPADSVSVTVQYDVTSAVGVLTSEPFEIKIFPNPVRDHLNITINHDADIKIFDSLGHLMTDKALRASTNSIDMRHFESGGFFYEIITEKGIQAGKIIKQ